MINKKIADFLFCFPLSVFGVNFVGSATLTHYSSERAKYNIVRCQSLLHQSRGQCFF